jgi:D-serine deaminase-like pyridoxal phosphate-dependent protein
MTIDQLDTPAVLVDLDRLERNIDRMGRYADEHRLALRPHTKTHKNVDIAKRQLAAGAHGITVAKPGEAAVMANGGIDDIMVAYPIVSAQKAARLAELAERARLRVSLDSVEAVRCLSEACAARGTDIGILVEVDVGFGRCGVAIPDDALRIAREAGSRFEGLMFYPGHMAKPSDEQTPLIADANRRLQAHYEAFRKAGIPIRTVSGGSTPTAFRSHEFEGVTEIRPGMYAFLDRKMVAIGVGGLDDCAVSVLVTVVSNAVPGRAMVDGGSKTFSSDAMHQPGYGLILEHPEYELIAFSEEHGHLSVTDPPRVGERLRIVPNHVCATTNLHEKVYGIRNGVVEREITVDARGRVQ